ncbi:hypothetical protein [Clostridium manihotivorum]|uniref:hypothetical protein n=1 Tax=Clostridium manihotivorum TaxID=2320868 RepID=UPI0013E30978|nr:hypothetical protein [Clostridium manihotivorum]
MDKVIDIANVVLYKKACEVLRKNKIPFYEEKLRNDAELCKKIIELLERYD